MAKQKQYLVILTMQSTQQVTPGGSYSVEYGYVARTFTAQPGWKRIDLLTEAQAQLTENARSGVVLFFSAEPLELP